MNREHRQAICKPSPGLRPPSPKGRGGLFLLAAFLLTGCATYAERTLKLHNAYYDNQLAAAESEVAERLKHDRANSDLIQLDAAMIELAAGNAKAAEQTLRAVRDHFDYLEQPAIHEKAAAMLTD